MKRLIAVVAAMAAIVVFAETETQAQNFIGGYQFGAGINSFGGFGCNRFEREQPPYFAKFPPVYYGNIVKRPYGISPYAAPAGIAPIEMSVPQYVVPPVTKVNPYYQPVAEPAKNQKQENAVESKNDKVTWTSNPFYVDTVQGIVAAAPTR